MLVTLMAKPPYLLILKVYQSSVSEWNLTRIRQSISSDKTKEQQGGGKVRGLFDQESWVIG
jgi:hypothetical protein